MSNGTLAATIDATGISSPDYDDILAQLNNAYWSIYGSDADLSPDSQDGQLLAIFAQAIYDANQMAIAVYNQFSPATAQGAGLSSVVKINGIARNVSTNSTADIAIGGTFGTVINGGMVGDNLNLGTQWALPGSVTIPESGTITITATCTTPGAVAAAPNTLTQILTPVAGWNSANNPAAAAVGQPIEDDAQLRQRQSSSVALPSQTTLESIQGNLEALSGVQEVLVYENDTDSTNGNGIPGHSIAAVILGGNAQMIAQTIEQAKSEGTGTYGTTTELVIDPNGIPISISFFVLVQVTIVVVVTITPLTGYASTTATLIEETIAQFISNLTIGETSYLNKLWAPANLSGDAATSATGLTQAQLDQLNSTYNVTAILQCISGGSPAVADIDIPFNEQAICAAANVTVNT